MFCAIFFILILCFCIDQDPLIEQHGFLLLVILLLLFSSLHNMLLYTILHVMCHCSTLRIVQKFDYVDEIVGEMLLVIFFACMSNLCSQCCKILLVFFLYFFFARIWVKKQLLLDRPSIVKVFTQCFVAFCFPYRTQNSDIYQVLFFLS